ncbi:MAG: penicillin-binding protein 2 [Minisyncoccia bacterium]
MKSLRNNFIKRKENYLDPEEILLDRKSLEYKDLNRAKLEWPLASFLLHNIKFIILITIVILLGRVFYLETVKGDYYYNLSTNNKTRYFVINPPRGIIYDRYHKPLVLNSPSYSLTLIPLDLPRDFKERNKIINEVINIFNLDKSEIDKILSNPLILNSIDPILLKPNLDLEEIRKFEAGSFTGKGFTIISDINRYYPYKEIFSHVIGYVGRVSLDDKKLYPDYPLTALVGKDGLEAYYENILQGQWGKRLVEVDAHNNIIEDLGINQPIKGNDLITTLDSDLQIQIYQVLSKRLNELGLKKGAALALDPNSGEILSLVSIPSFDPNVLTKGSPKTIILNYLNSLDYVFLNRVISGLYSPGSVIKPLMAIAALTEKIITPQTVINDEGKIVINNPYNPQITYTFKDWDSKGFGKIDVKKALAYSSNVFFWMIGGGYKDFKGLGLSLIQKYWRLFLLGQKHNIDLYGEMEGLLPDEKQLAQNRPNDPNWKVGDTYNISIGEGGLNLTLLQIADYISTIVNDGVLMQPHLVKEINGDHAQIIQPKILNKLNIDKNTFEVVKEGMREVVTIGTAKSLNSVPIEVAGKSGSPEYISQGKKQYNALFVAFAPYKNPKIVLVILIEQPPQGSVATLPVVQEILTWYALNRLPQENTSSQ